MAYRFEKNQNGQQDLVIDGWEKGIAISPFKGIGSIKNLNIKYYEGVAYVNYKRQACTMTGGTMGKPLYACQSPAGLIYIADDSRQIWKQGAVNGSSFAVLTGNYNQPINGIAFWNNYLFVLGGDLNGEIEVCGDGTGDGGVTSSNWNSPTPSSTIFTVTIAAPAVFTANNHGLSVGDVIRLSTTGALPTGLSTNTDYFVIAAGFTTNAFEVSTTSGGAAVNTSGTQSGTHSFIKVSGVWPIKNSVSMTLTAAPATGATSGTISSYIDAGGTTHSFWNGPSGFYNISISQANGSTQVVLANLTQGLSTISWTPALNSASTSTSVFPFYNGGTSNATGIEHPSLVAANDGNLYFCNGSNLAAFTLNSNQIFNKNSMSTFEFNANILSLPPTETSTWLTEIRNNLIVMGKYKLYPWDFFSPFWTNPIPMDENIIKGINILNNIYIFAGNKGNVYISNGYNVERYLRIPDFVAGVIDPSWTIGGVMQHRQKLYFQALAKNGQTGSAIMAGIFSIDLDNKTINMENQNSGGIAPAGITAQGVLLDVSNSTINYDKYYSAYGATTSSIDFNDTTLYSSNEAVIETDIVPIGTALQPKTFQSAEFKLDQPLQSGDSISLYARQSLSDSYTLIGTTTSAVLSFATTPIPFEKWQWAQFKVTMSCNATATSSSFNRLRELRIR